MLKANYHTHTKLCRHAIGEVIDYVKVAYECGFSEIGISDHAPYLERFMTKEEFKRSRLDTGAMDFNELDEYFHQIKEAKIKYPRVKVLTGFETEFLEDEIDYYKELKKKVDYLNLGIHFLKKNGHIIDTYLDLDYSNLSDYVNNIENAVKSGLYTTICHPDLFMFGYKDRFGNWSFDDECIKATRRICEIALKYDMYLEVNANGLKYAKDKNNMDTWKYPYPKFWEIVKEYKDIKIIIGADAHEPNALCSSNVLDVIEFTKNLGLNVLDFMEVKK